MPPPSCPPWPPTPRLSPRGRYRRLEVYNLSKPADLSGNYTAVTAGATVIAGGSVAYLKNENGVVIKLHSQTEGLRFNLSANGMHITLQ